jgi:glutamine synthetase
MTDTTYDNTSVTGWQHGYPDALARWTWTPAQRALGQQRALLPGRVRQRRRHAACRVPAADAQARAGARREDGLPGHDRHGVRVVQLPRDAAHLGRQERRAAGADHARHVRLFAAAHGRQPRLLQRADGRDAGLQRARSKACTPRPARACTKWRSASPRRWSRPTAPSCSRPAPSEIGKRFGIMPSFMAKWSQQYPGCSGHIHQSLSDGKNNLFYDARARAR